MNRDNKKLERIYESISNPNFLNKNYLDEDFDWDYFFERASLLNMFDTLIESVDLIDVIEDTNQKEEKYEIITINNKKFYLIITYQYKKKNDVFIFNGIQKNTQYSAPEAVQYFKDLKNRMPEDGILCYIRFEDEQGRTNQTNEVGSDALELFGVLRATISKSLDANNNVLLYGIVVLIAKTEEKQRLSLYKRILEKYKDLFPNMLVDRNTDTDYICLITTKEA